MRRHDMYRSSCLHPVHLQALPGQVQRCAAQSTEPCKVTAMAALDTYPPQFFATVGHMCFQACNFATLLTMAPDVSCRCAGRLMNILLPLLSIAPIPELSVSLERVVMNVTQNLACVAQRKPSLLLLDVGHALDIFETVTSQQLRSAQALSVTLQHLDLSGAGVRQPK